MALAVDSKKTSCLAAITEVFLGVFERWAEGMLIGEPDRQLLHRDLRALPAVVLGEIAAERMRQITKEGWSLEHDDEHTDGSLADAAACYAATTRAFKAEEFAGVGYKPYTSYSDLWPKSWADRWFRPKKSRRRRLIVAAALLVAEIERLDRLE